MCPSRLHPYGQNTRANEKIPNSKELGIEICNQSSPRSGPLLKHQTVQSPSAQNTTNFLSQLQLLCRVFSPCVLPLCLPHALSVSALCLPHLNYSHLACISSSTPLQIRLISLQSSPDFQTSVVDIRSWRQYSPTLTSRRSPV